MSATLKRKYVVLIPIKSSVSEASLHLSELVVDLRRTAARG